MYRLAKKCRIYEKILKPGEVFKAKKEESQGFKIEEIIDAMCGEKFRIQSNSTVADISTKECTIGEGTWFEKLSGFFKKITLICELPWKQFNELEIGYIELSKSEKTELTELA